MENIDYQFTKVPTKLFMCLDNNCRSMLFTLIQLSTMYADEQGWFFRANADLEADTKLSRRVMDGTLDALLRHMIIDFVPQQQGAGVKQTSRIYKVNYGTFLSCENISIEDCLKNPKYKIETSNYKKGSFSWQGKEWVGKKASLSLTSTQTSTPTLSQPQHKVTTSIDNVDNTNSLDNLNKNSLNKFNIISKNENDITKEQVNDKEQGVVNNNDSLDNSNYNNNNNKLSAPCTIEAAGKPLRDSDKPYVTTIGEKLNEAYQNGLIKLIDMRHGIIPKDDNVFRHTAKICMDLYGFTDYSKACKEVNLFLEQYDEYIKANGVA